MVTAFVLDELLTPGQKARLRQGQARLQAAGMVSIGIYDDCLKPIVKEERLQDIWAAITARLLENYPGLLLEDSGPLSGSLQMATYIGLLLGSQYSFPPELVALIQPEDEASA